MTAPEHSIKLTDLNQQDRRERIEEHWTQIEQFDSDMFGSTISVLPATAGDSAINQDVGSRIAPKPRHITQRHQSDNQNGDFTLNNVIGRGGTSLIYDAQQSGLNRSVAVKIHQSGDESERFLVEAGIIALLEHPNIVPIYEAGKNKDNTHFFAMRKISGLSWRQKIDKLNIQENLDILLHVINAIIHAHSRHILHCDIKPENIMVGSFGEVSLIDWGLSMYVNENGAIPVSKDGVIGGTPPYMAPEQALIIPELIGKHTDTYLLSGLLYRFCTGHAPHPGTTNRECILTAAQNLLTEHNPEDQLVQIALKGLSEIPENRYQTAEEFRDAIINWKKQTVINTLLNDARTTFRQARNGAYSQYARALFIAEEANLKLSESDKNCNELIIEIRNNYAQTSIDRGDLHLAKEILTDECDQSLMSDIKRALSKNQKRARRTRQLRIGILSMLIFIITISIIGAIFASIKQSETKQSLSLAITENNKSEKRSVNQMYAAAQSEIDEGRFIAGRYKLNAIPVAERNENWTQLFNQTQIRWQEIQLGEGAQPKKIAIDNKENFIVCTFDLYSIAVFSLKTLKMIYRSPNSARRISYFDITPDGQHVIYKDRDTIKVIELATLEIVNEYDQIHHSKIMAIGEHQYVTDRKDAICSFNFLTGEQVWEVDMHPKSQGSEFINLSNNEIILSENEHLFSINLHEPDKFKIKDKRSENCSYLSAAYNNDDLHYFITYPNGHCMLLSNHSSHYNKFNLRTRPDVAAINISSNMFAFASNKMREVFVKHIHNDKDPHIFYPPAPPLAMQFIEKGARLVVGVQDQLIILNLNP